MTAYLAVDIAGIILLTLALVANLIMMEAERRTGRPSGPPWLIRAQLVLYVAFALAVVLDKATS